MKVTINGVDKLIKKYENIQNYSLEDKVKKLISKLGELGYEVAYDRYNEAYYAGDNDVEVYEPRWVDDNTLLLEAHGRKITFIEFGTGTHMYGADLHPYADEFGFVRGRFGYHLGLLRSWRYWGEKGNLGVVIKEGKHKGMISTEGNPPAMAMYYAGKKMRENILTIAKEVLNGRW